MAETYYALYIALPHNAYGICHTVYLPIYLFTYLPIYLSTYLPIYLSIRLSVYLSICPSIYLSIYLVNPLHQWDECECTNPLGPIWNP